MEVENSTDFLLFFLLFLALILMFLLLVFFSHLYTNPHLTLSQYPWSTKIGTSRSHEIIIMEALGRLEWTKWPPALRHCSIHRQKATVVPRTRLLTVTSACVQAMGNHCAHCPATCPGLALPRCIALILCITLYASSGSTLDTGDGAMH